MRHRKAENTGGKLYVCELCNERFSQKGNFKPYRLRHTSEKPQVCD